MAVPPVGSVDLQHPPHHRQVSAGGHHPSGRIKRSLSDETRTRVLLTLREAPAYPSDLADAFGVSRQVMSNQLACLRGCGLVEAVPDGRRTWYRLADPHLAPALDDLVRLVVAVDPSCCSPETGECTCS